jgi:hypothetical protein
MGRAKEWMMQQEERGHSAADGDICAECVSDSFLAEWIEANATATVCRFCGRDGDEPIAASFDEFVGLVVGAIGFDWNHPDNEGIMYVTADGGYQAAVSDIYDVLDGIDISEDAEVIEALIESIDDNGWVERDYYVGDKSQRLSWGWESFKQVTKHQTRYLFLSPKAEDRSSVPASQMLDAIGEVIASDLGDFDFVKTIGADTDLIRIRIDPAAYKTAGEIGSPPEEHAVQSNRMSPAGVPMFYGAFDLETAKAETFDPAKHAGQTMSIGAFRALRDLQVLDLAQLPDIPSLFDTESHYLIHPLRFLHAFAEDLAKPIAHDGREHIEYVPTQIVTEYFRRVFQGPGKTPLDGLIYRSARHPGGKAFVLFCENAQCVDPDAKGEAWDKPLLRLESVAHELCPGLPNLL